MSRKPLTQLCTSSKTLSRPFNLSLIVYALVFLNAKSNIYITQVALSHSWNLRSIGMKKHYKITLTYLAEFYFMRRQGDTHLSKRTAYPVLCRT